VDLDCTGENRAGDSIYMDVVGKHPCRRVQWARRRVFGRKTNSGWNTTQNLPA
jgi:hypothetical protein